ncbi:hypothetical protein L208DRAFT_1375547 [Tricholoma matsutake]|nr:hypothetical protein L208DRAFT_1375547 [Tricholoma matsutake 945]
MGFCYSATFLLTLAFFLRCSFLLLLLACWSLYNLLATIYSNPFLLMSAKHTSKGSRLVTDQLAAGTPPVSSNICPRRVVIKTEKAKAIEVVEPIKRKVPLTSPVVAAAVPNGGVASPEWQDISDGLCSPADLTKSDLPEVSEI